MEQEAKWGHCAISFSYLVAIQNHLYINYMILQDYCYYYMNILEVYTIQSYK